MKNFQLLIFFLLASGLFAQNSNLYIYEILASNNSTNISTIYSEYADWIEIINKGSVLADISGYYLTDDVTEPAKWRIPDNTIIQPNGIVLFWADNMDTTDHTNFKLDRDGEFTGFFSPGGAVIDSVTFGYQQDDISYGRKSDNISEWAYFLKPTPRLQNSTETVDGFAPAPQFSIPGGFYNSTQTLALSANDQTAVIRYTIDGTLPDENSKPYATPITLDSTTSIRARTYINGRLPGEIITYTYFIDEPVHLPIVSLVTDPANLFDDSIGIYITGKNGRRGDCDPTIRNLNQDWERPVNIELYEKTGEMRLNQAAGIKIFGGCSRTRYPEKSFALYARSDYGKGSFDYQLFPDKPIKKFEAFLLRSASDDQVYTMYRDGLAHTVLAEKELDLDYQAFRPAVVFINGQYWGIHNIREKVNENYLRENYDLGGADVTLLERNADPMTGTSDEYDAMIDFVSKKNMTLVSNYNYIKTQMDVTQYINYQIGHIHLAEKDWPGNNIRFWKASTGKYTRWRWINYDMDQVFLHTNTNSLEMAASPNGWSWPNPPWSTLLFRKLLMNKDFKNEFIQTYAYLLNNTFKPERLIHYIDSLRAIIVDEIPRHITKWGGKLDPDFAEGWPIFPTFNSIDEWEKNIDTMRVFSHIRHQLVIDHLTNFFNLSGMVNLSLSTNKTGAGKVKIINRLISKNGFSGTFFKNIPLSIEAVPYTGYKFLYWKFDDSTSTQQKLVYTPQEDLTVTAFFEKETASGNPIVINEINYNSSDVFDPGDWIEIYNKQNQSMDISGWYIMDEKDEDAYTIPQGIEISANGYLVFCEKDDDFKALFPPVNNYTGNFNFGLKSGGEIIRLFSKDSILIDSVRYDNSDPWPSAPDGTGSTLELKDPSTNNDLAQNWSSSAAGHGTPGIVNSTVTEVPEHENNNIVYQFILYDNYPNPFNPSTKIKFSIPAPLVLLSQRSRSDQESEAGDEVGGALTQVMLKVYDILGKEVAVLVNEYKTPGNYEVEFNSGKYSLSSGVYFYQLRANDFVSTKKLVLLK